MGFKKPGDSFYSTFMPLVEAINTALQEAYDTACESYDPGSGSNQATFGTHLYAAANFQLQELLEDAGARVLNTQKMIFQIGEYFLECRNVSSITGANIENCFPAKGQPLSVCEDQIPLWDDDESIENERNLVLAHMGNANEGFTSAYLCIRRYVGKKLTWAFTEGIFNIEGSASIAPAVKKGAALWSVPEPEAKKIPKPGVVRKKKPDSKNPEE